MIAEIREIVAHLDERDRLILEHAMVEFATNGYHNASMDKVCQEAGIGKGTLYRRFHSKNMLFFTTLWQGYQDFLVALDRVSPMESLETQIDQYFDTAVRFTLRHTNLIRLIFHERSRVMEELEHENILPLLKEIREQGVRFWQRVFDQAEALGRLAADYDLEHLLNLIQNIIAGMNNDIVLMCQSITREILEQRVQCLKQLLFHGIFKPQE